MLKFKFKFQIYGEIEIKGDGTCAAKDIATASVKAKNEIAQQFRKSTDDVNITSLIQVK